MDHLRQDADLRVVLGWVVVAELVHPDTREGGADEVGPARLVRAFLVDGGSARREGIPLGGEVLRKRSRLDLCQRQAALNLEYLQNLERAGAASAENNVVTSSLGVPFCCPGARA